MTVFEDHVRAKSFFWPKDEFEYLTLTMYNFQVSYIALAAMGVEAGKLRFGYPAKGHYFEHLVVDHLGLVPRPCMVLSL